MDVEWRDGCASLCASLTLVWVVAVCDVTAKKSRYVTAVAPNFDLYSIFKTPNFIRCEFRQMISCVGTRLSWYTEGMSQCTHVLTHSPMSQCTHVLKQRISMSLRQFIVLMHFSMSVHLIESRCEKIELECMSKRHFKSCQDIIPAFQTCSRGATVVSRVRSFWLPSSAATTTGTTLTVCRACAHNRMRSMCLG